MSFTEQNELFALVDCNNFYVSCERVFNPHLRNRPVVILSNNDGCIVARSQEAKDLGIPMGAPYFQWKEMIIRNRVITLSSNYTLYGDLSKRVMSTLSTFTDHMEIYSIDESFLQMPLDTKEKDLYHIRNTTLQWTGIPTSVGLAPTKTLAKLASKLAKKTGGIFSLTDSSTRDALLDKTSVEDIWGIGRQLHQFLMAKGIKTAKQLQSADDGWLKANLTVVGLRLAWELRGISCLPIEEVPAAKKAIMSSKSFGRDVYLLHELQEAIACYTATASEKLRSQDSVCSWIEVYLKEVIRDGGRVWRKHIVLPKPTCDTSILIHFATSGLKQIYQPNVNYKKTGILLSGLVPEDNYQLDLFCPTTVKEEKKRHLLTLMDKSNAYQEKLWMATQGTKRSWKMKCDKRTPSYTTSWDNILTVKI
ncbi:MAG: Y-family DNA polymerase [Parachlamydiales bacterium]|nr:Y-family DNA polymerase [Parachlamydiales bacterium]